MMGMEESHDNNYFNTFNNEFLKIQMKTKN